MAGETVGHQSQVRTQLAHRQVAHGPLDGGLAGKFINDLGLL